MEAVRLLYIEDNDKQRKELSSRLRKKGFHVTAARSGGTGISFFEKRSFEAVLCDLNMPGKSGEDVLEAVRERDGDIPFVIMSAHGTVSQAVKTIKKGADHFILKPADIDEITITINQAIERKKLEATLADSQATLQMVAESVPDIIYSLNTKGEFLSLSPASKSSLGYDPEELLGSSVFNLVHPEDRPWVAKDFAHTMKIGGKEVKNLMFRLISKAGQVKHFEISRRLITDATGIVRIDGIARDDTERVSLQNKLEEYSQKLEKMVAERTKSLEYTTHQLSALNRVSSHFSKIFDEEKLFDNVSTLLTRTLDFDRAYLVLGGDDGLHVRSCCSGVGSRKPMDAFLKKVEKGLAKLPPHVNESFKKRKTIFVRDIKKDRRWPKGPTFLVQAKSVVITPVRVKRQVIGVIVGSMDDRERDMNKQDVERFETFANMVGLALDNIRAYQSMEQKVIERTESLKKLNKELQDQAVKLEDSRIELAYANVDLLGVQEDLQKKNEEMEGVLKELSKRSRELQIVVDAGLSAILLVDNSGQIQLVNKRVAEYFGVGQDDVIGKSCGDFANMIKGSFEDSDKFLRLLADLDKDPDVPGEVDPHELYDRALTLKGSTRVIISPIVVPVLDETEQEIGRIWVYSNITSLIQADQQVHAIVEASPIPTIISRIDDGKILFVNEQLASLVGTTPEKLLGRTTPDFYYHKEDRTRMISMLKATGSVNDFETRIKRVDGTVIWVIFSLVITEISGEKVILGGLYDISERKHFEEALEKERNFVSAVLDTAGALVVVLDKDGKIVRFNRACEENSGYSFKEIKNKTFWDIFVTPEDMETAKSFHAKLYAGQFPMSVETCWVTKSDERRLISWSSTCLLDGEGNVEFMVLIGIDITDQRKAEDTIANRLRYEEGLADFSRTLLTGDGTDDALPGALEYLLEASGAGRVYIFENFEDETDGWCMRQILEVCSPDVEPQIDNPDLQHMPHSQLTDRWRNLLTKGEPVKGLVSTFSDEEKAVLQPQGILSMVCIPIKVEGNWYGFIGFDEVKSEREWDDEDIRTLQTAAEIIGIYIERKKFEETLHISEEKFRSLVENANDIIYSLTPEGEFSYISPMAKDIMGYEVSELLGKSLFPILHPDDLQESVDWFKSGFQQHDVHIEGYEFRMVHKDGSIRWFTTKASPILDENEEVFELIGVAHDITQMKNVLEEIENTNRHLRETQAQLAQSEKMASLGVLVAGIAHEINTPLGAMSSMHDTLIRSIVKLKDLINTNISEEHDAYPALKATLDLIDDSNKVITSGTERVTNIVRRLRSFARLDEAELKTVDIHEGLEDTLTLMHHSIKHDIVVRKNYGKIPPISCYPGQLNQVFLNLLVNARQAITGKGEISLTTYKEDDKAVIKISDTGVGISKKHLSHIFDPGFTTKGVGVGTGLGLAICYNILQNHKGEITVESELQKGTTFTVTLPINLHVMLNTEPK